MYNSMSQLPAVPYNILTYLAKEEQILWKLLAYEGYDALNKPDLTFSQKMQLLWKEGPQENYNIFLTDLVEDAIAESKCILKIYMYYIHASNLYLATPVYAFDFLCGGKMSLVDYNGLPVSRGDLFINRILTNLNGAEVNGIGKLMFNEDLSRYCLARSLMGNSKTFKVTQLFLATQIGDKGEIDEC